VSRDAQPLREALGQSWTVQEWEARPMEWRRAVVKLVCASIVVAPTLRRGAVKGQLVSMERPAPFRR
jgi:hypothetical protein